MNTARRVLVLFGSVPLYGHERGNIDDMEVLRKSGWDVLFVTHPEWGHVKIQPELDARGFRWTTATFAERFDRGIGVRGWWRRLRAIVRGSFDLARILRRFRPSVIHVGNLTWFVDFAPALLATRVPIVYRLGDSPPRHRAAFRFFWRHVVGRRVTLFICISRFVCERLHALARVEEKTHLLYNRPPTRPGRRAANESPRERGPGLRFGYVGQITEEKGVALIVEAALRLCREYPEARFDLVGGLDSEPKFAAAQIERVQEAELQDRIRFAGYLDDVESFFQGIDVHLCPSICEEALGLTVLEAKQQGVPSIVFPSGGLPEIVLDGIDGRVSRGKDVDSLEDACREYLLRPSLVAAHGAGARTSLARIGIPQFEERLIELYERASSGA